MSLSDAEWKVMHCVWRAPPVTARAVHDELVGETGWSYSTVRTLLGRLVDKGVAAGNRRGNTRVYAPLVSREEARASAVRGLLDRAFDGTFGALVHHLVGDRRLSRRDQERLRAMLEELDARHDGRGDPSDEETP